MTRALRSGFTCMWRNKRLAVIFFLSNLCFGLVLALPFRQELEGFLNNSMVAERLAGRFDMDFAFEFVDHLSSPAGHSNTSLLMLVPLGYWVITLFVSAGAFVVLMGFANHASNKFWGGAVRYFGRFFRLSMLALPLLGFLLLAFVLFESLLERLIFGEDPYQSVTYWGNWIKVALAFLAVTLSSIAVDYGRIHTILADQQRMRISLWDGIAFVRQNFLTAMGIGLTPLIIGGAGLLLYNLVANLFSAPEAASVVMLVLCQQSYMLFRMMLRVMLYGGEIALFRTQSDLGIVASKSDYA